MKGARRVHARASDHLVWASRGAGAAVGMQRWMVVEPIWHSKGRVNNRRRTKLYLIYRFESCHIEFRRQNQSFKCINVLNEI